MPAPLSSDWLGKTAVVTGGARGQGACVARLLLEAGAAVLVLDVLPPSDVAWQTLKAGARGLPGHLLPVQGDVADEATWLTVVDQVQELGLPLRGLVNNAGITGARAPVTQTDLAQWESVMAVNLTGSFLGVRHLAPLMERGAAIVNVSSVTGLTGYFSAAYTCSKWALRGLTRSAALELAPRGVRVNCICPGVVDTDMIRNHPALVQALQTIVPMQQMAQADQLAEVIFFLLGSQAAYITGADLAVDGGLSGGGIFWPVGRSLGVLGVTP